MKHEWGAEMICEEKLVSYAEKWLHTSDIREYYRIAQTEADEAAYYKRSPDDWPKWYLLEIVTHEMGHWAGLGQTLQALPDTPNDISFCLRNHSNKFADFNEIRATVVTLCVGEALGAPEPFMTKAEASMYGNIGEWFRQDCDDAFDQLSQPAAAGAFNRMRRSRRTNKMARAITEELQRQGVLA